MNKESVDISLSEINFDFLRSFHPGSQIIIKDEENNPIELTVLFHYHSLTTNIDFGIMTLLIFQNKMRLLKYFPSNDGKYTDFTIMTTDENNQSLDIAGICFVTYCNNDICKTTYRKITYEELKRGEVDTKYDIFPEDKYLEIKTLQYIIIRYKDEFGAVIECIKEDLFDYTKHLDIQRSVKWISFE